MIVGMRPNGAAGRIRAAQSEDRAWLEARPALRLGAMVRRFTTLSGLQWYHDHPVERTLEALGEIAEIAAGGGQRPSSAYARENLAMATSLTDRLGSARAEGLTPEEQDEAWELLVTIPPRTLLRRDDPDAHADLVLVNEAHWHAEGVSTAYGAASAITAVGYFRPDDRWDVASRMAGLRVRYEDEPDARSEVAAEITATLSRFLVDYDTWWRAQGD